MYSTPDSSIAKHCEQCGQEFACRKFVGNRQRFCSDACRVAWNTKHGRSIVVCICKHCGREFQPKVRNREQFCSRECSYAERKRQQQERLQQKQNEQPVCFCEVCGNPVNSKWSKTCSDECKRERARRKAQEWFKSNDKRDRSPRACKECGKMFVPEYGNKRRTFCSSKCQKKNGRRGKKISGTFNGVARKRLRAKHGESWRAMYEPINKRRVFERDKWTCQLCGCKVKRTTQWHPRQATIDHVVPFALGGEHKYANVQTACNECNSKKGATVQGQQRLL